MPNFKLTYFNVRGRAETSRMLFALVGQDYVDERIPFEDWPKVKQSESIPYTLLGARIRFKNNYSIFVIIAV